MNFCAHDLAIVSKWPGCVTERSIAMTKATRLTVVSTFIRELLKRKESEVRELVRCC